MSSFVFRVPRFAVMSFNSQFVVFELDGVRFKGRRNKRRAGNTLGCLESSRCMSVRFELLKGWFKLRDEESDKYYNPADEEEWEAEQEADEERRDQDADE